ncbi:MAG: hypothetical protein DME06_06745 [Candidatus Rokuibacteriota bacterium]|nr:MAG: hypothetical protein DME06_06745 [Candidatus Rokubacteria bacterium]
MSFAIGILVIRVLFGAAIAAHGAQKLFGWFGGYGLKGTGGVFEQLGFRPGIAFAAAAALSECAGGILLTLGLFTPLGASAILAAMLVAIVSVHLKNGFFAMANGVELPFLYAAVALGAAHRRGTTRPGYHRCRGDARVAAAGSRPDIGGTALKSSYQVSWRMLAATTSYCLNQHTAPLKR